MEAFYEFLSQKNLQKQTHVFLREFNTRNMGLFDLKFKDLTVDTDSINFFVNYPYMGKTKELAHTAMSSVIFFS
jgi:hypothetical protein